MRSDSLWRYFAHHLTSATSTRYLSHLRCRTYDHVPSQAAYSRKVGTENLLTREAIELLEKLLALDPKGRSSAKKVRTLGSVGTCVVLTARCARLGCFRLFQTEFITPTTCHASYGDWVSRFAPSRLQKHALNRFVLQALSARYFSVSPRCPDEIPDLGPLCLPDRDGSYHEYQTKKKRKEDGIMQQDAKRAQRKKVRNGTGNAVEYIIARKETM